MSNISFDLSEKVESRFVKALHSLKDVSEPLDIPFFVVGAFARDLLLEGCYNIKSPRITQDIDLGVLVTDWNQYKTLSKTLIDSREFVKEKEKQRYRFESVMLDILPFGPIADEYKRISWPPEHEIFLNILGFIEAYRSSITVLLCRNTGLTVRIPLLSGLALLKIISWKDRYPDRKTDAEDLLFLMQHYEEAGNRDRLFDDEQSLLMEEEFDMTIAGIRLLGRDIARISNRETLERIMEILEEETGDQSRYNLVADMLSGYSMQETEFEEILYRLSKLNEGLRDRTSM
jgi:predicted nucleotidyltransferase